jgi:RHS repeat-associated protein
MKRERGLVRPVACAAAVLRRFVYGPGIDQPVRMDVATAPGGPSFTKYYYHLDGLGNVIALSNAAGTVVEQYAYDAYGLPSTTSAVGNPYLFNARCYDSETGLYYYRARYYDPRIGRFLQPDPVGYGPALNLYAYCRDNPLNLLDPHGLWSLLKWLYAGDGNASDAEYQAAVDTAAQWLLGTSPVRGGYVGVRKGWKPKGTSVGRAVGAVGSWTMDEGFGVDVGGGLGVRAAGFPAPCTNRGISAARSGLVGTKSRVGAQPAPSEARWEPKGPRTRGPARRR